MIKLWQNQDDHILIVKKCYGEECDAKELNDSDTIF